MPSILLPRHADPSYKAGFARSAAESDNPGLWDSLSVALSPTLGPKSNDGWPPTYAPGLSANPSIASESVYSGVHGGMHSYSATFNEVFAAWRNDSPIHSSTNYTLLIAFHSARVAAGNILAEWENSNNSRGIQIRRSSSGYLMRVLNSDGTKIAETDPKSIDTGNYVCVWQVDGTAIRYFQLQPDGTLFQDTDTASVMPDAAVTRFGNQTIQADLNLHAYYGWNRQLSGAEVSQVIYDLAAPFRLKPRVFSIAGGATPTDKAITGTITSVSTATATLTELAPISGTITSVSTATATLTELAPISGTITSGTTATATLDKVSDKAITGTITSVSTATATLTELAPISGTITSGTTADITLDNTNVNRAITGTITSGTTATIALAETAPITGTITSGTTATVTLTGLHAIIASAISASTATADLAGGLGITTVNEVLQTREASRTLSVFGVETRTVSVAPVTRTLAGR